METTKTLSGALFKNDKDGNDKRPDYKGTYTDGQGEEFWVSAWVKESKTGSKYMSLSMQPKGDKKPQSHTSKQEFAIDSTDNELPF